MKQIGFAQATMTSEKAFVVQPESQLVYQTVRFVLFQTSEDVIVVAFLDLLFQDATCSFRFVCFQLTSGFNCSEDWFQLNGLFVWMQLVPYCLLQKAQNVDYCVDKLSEEAFGSTVDLHGFFFS